MSLLILDAIVRKRLETVMSFKAWNGLRVRMSEGEASILLQL